MAFIKKKDKKETTGNADSKSNQSPAKEPTPPKPEKKRKKKGFFSKIIFMGIALIALGGAGFSAYYYFFSPKVYHHRLLEKVTINPDLVEFSFYHLPDLYAVLVETNNKETLIGKEIERLSKIAEDFPSQQQIVISETALLDAAMQNIKMLREELEKNIEMIYVSFHVNQEKGLNLIESNKDLLATRAKQTLAAHDPLFERLNAERNKQGILTRLKHLF